MHQPFGHLWARCALLLLVLGSSLAVVALAGCRGTGTRAEEQLIRAAERGDLGEVRAALDSGAAVDQNLTGLNALHSAALNGHREVVALLLARGAAVDAPTRLGKTALHLAAGMGRAGVIEELIAAGAALDAQDDRGRTALMDAAARGADDVASALLSAGARRDIRDHEGLRAFEHAQAGHHTATESLLQE